MNPVLTRTYADLPERRREILRYAGWRGDGEPSLLTECMAETVEIGPGRVCYRCFPIRFLPDEIDLGFSRTPSRSLRTHLENCTAVLLFAATVGLGFDRLIEKYANLSPAKSLLFQAIGAARVETLCDQFCTDIANEYGPLRSRYSPGYGDLPLTLQREIFAVLDCQRKIGLTLGESLLMSPTKSVTAIVGLGGGTLTKENACAICGAAACDYRSK